MFAALKAWWTREPESYSPADDPAFKQAVNDLMMRSVTDGYINGYINGYREATGAAGEERSELMRSARAKARRRLGLPVEDTAPAGETVTP